MKKLIFGLSLILTTSAFAVPLPIHLGQYIKVRTHGKGAATVNLEAYPVHEYRGEFIASNIPGPIIPTSPIRCDGRLEKNYDCTQRFNLVLVRSSSADWIQPNLGYKFWSLATNAETQQMEISLVCGNYEKKLTPYPLFKKRTDQEHSPLIEWVINTEELYSQRCEASHE